MAVCGNFFATARLKLLSSQMRNGNVVRLSSTPLCVSSHGTEAVLALGLAQGGIAAIRVDGLFESTLMAAIPPSADPSPVTTPTTVARNATHQMPRGNASVMTLAFQSGPTTTFFAGTEGIVHQFDMERTKPVREFALPPAHDRAGDEISGTDSESQGLITGTCARNAQTLTFRNGRRVPSTIYSYDVHTFLVGDDDGGVHLYDVRVGKDSGPTGCVAEALEQADYISSLQRVEKYGTRAILATSGDGTLCAYDVRRLPTARVKLEYAFDKFDDDILSLGIVECSSGESIGVAGTLCGMLNLYNMQFMDVNADPDTVAHVDRFPGHPECVNSVLACPAKDVAVTASSDGFVRVVDVVSKTLLGVLNYRDNVTEADTDANELKNSDNTANAKGTKRRRNHQSSKWPIESMVHVNGAANLAFALICHDEYVRFCDGSALVDEDDDDDDDDGGGGGNCDGDEDVGQGTKGNNEGCETTNDDDSREATSSKAVLSMPPEAALVRRDKKGKKRKNNEDDEKYSKNSFFEDL